MSDADHAIRSHPTPTPVTLLYPPSRQLSPRVRVFVDQLTKAFGQSRYGNAKRNNGSML